MAPLSLEVYDTQTKRWDKRSHVEPGSVPRMISGLNPSGDKVTYFYECSPGDSHSELYRSRFVSESVIHGNVKAVTGNRSDLELVKVLRKGDGPYTLQLEIRGTQYQLRFTHE